MTATTARPTWTGPIDSFTLNLMREAAAFRAANPDPEHAASDAYCDALLESAEAAYAAGRVSVETPAADDVATNLRRGDAVASGARGGYGTATGPSEAQERFIRSLAADLGWTEHATNVAVSACKQKRDASRLIDAMKDELAQARRTGAAPAASARPERPATERQIEYLRNLVRERETDVDPAAAETITAENTSARLASQLIEKFQTAPRRAAATPAAHGIREGRYAYQPEGAQAIFLRVSRTGRVYTQAGPAEHPYRGTGTPALLWIAENQKEAAALYGRLIGACGRCGRELTDEDSRARGLGPICADKAW